MPQWQNKYRSRSRMLRGVVLLVVLVTLAVDVTAAFRENYAAVGQYTRTIYLTTAVVYIIGLFTLLVMARQDSNEEMDSDE